MGTYRKRFNEKARAGHMARLKELKKVRNKQFTRHLDDGNNKNESDNVNTVERTDDTNAMILKPLSEEEKALKKRKLQELFQPKESKVSRMKKKRLDKFIEHQLKKEEKKTIIEKLQDYRVDTSLFTSSKRLGHGRDTKRDEIKEALSLEKQGRQSERTKEILYTEHEVKNWDEDNEENGDEDGDDDGDDDDFEEKFGDAGNSGSGFVDYRPKTMGGNGGFGLGFSNATVVKKKDKIVPKRKYNWRERVENIEKRNNQLEDEEDFMSSNESGSASDEYASEENSEVEGQEDGTVDIEQEVSEGELSNEGVRTEDSEGSESSGEDNDDDNEDSSDDDDMEEETTGKFEHSLEAKSFKNWAVNEIKKAEGRDVDLATPVLKNYTPIVRPEDLNDGLEVPYVKIDENLKRETFYVHVNRPEEIQEVRANLPVYSEEHRIMEAIHHNDVVIICGETGSGKTTQVPQFLYESGYGNRDSPDAPGMIGITQPRRVAAVSMANRVANEMGDHGYKVAHQIRFDTTVKDNTRMKFMTDGVLLREMMQDFKLTKYSSIIIDEAHERNINTDILIGMLSRAVKLRAAEHAKNSTDFKKLKLIIMSATLRVSDFSENKTLFDHSPPVVNVAARQFPVAVHFNRRTPYDYADEAFRKTCKIHRKLPPGAILIFMTGQQEITQMVTKLRKEFPFPDKTKIKNYNVPVSEVRVNAKTTDLEAEDVDFSVEGNQMEEFDDKINEDVDDYKDESENEEGFEETLEDTQTDKDPLFVLPLYSLLPTKEQMKVFQDPPKGSRLCIVATNVAETSLTIPGVRYVVDCGRSKERKYNEENGVQSFEIGWVSKASAGQRSGRAGRTGPGHCYRLYSSAVFERDFPQFSKPEILRMPVESVVLQMKSMAIHNILNFPFPTPPNRVALSKAVLLLKCLGALDNSEKITNDGKKMSLFPLSPRFSKMLLLSNEQKCLPYIVSIVSALSVGDPFIGENELGIANVNVQKQTGDDEESVEPEVDDLELEKKRALRAKFFKSRAKFSKLDKNSDIFKALSVISAMDYIPKDSKPLFLKNNFLKIKIMEEISKLRKQLLYIIKSNTSQENIAVSVTDEDLKSSIPNEIQIKLLKQMVCAGFIDQVAIRADYLFPEEAEITNRTSIINIPYIPVLAQKENNVEDMFTYIHPSSILANSGELPPKFLVYHSLHLSSTNKTRLQPLCDVKSTPLANIARSGSLLTYGKPLTGQGMKPINISVTERYCYVVPRFGSTIDSDLKVGWDLNPISVHQIKEKGQWQVTKFITNRNYKTMEKTKK
ncbi:hypothetical protein TPHA_0G02710 [Tetrapisispora phaffii CBS 4417]|uniref:RNA helicase n=1 Tax=Tetrapisispora phaffii (strain ATCC 24235 / CBS 4417 / NBRC 1672 / NRRL Y-8282 / UCD 70-5) TaxID=1071381 RepID=G8BW30_TETPH|nr:hypothetical protein TPHA_0G02710 [Tetrapisispora phaffii CBS 4417]CCE64108.1 hypothetical protein TPHA_0G02710 [Tetrapisispora phaffii CBS 4417]